MCIKYHYPILYVITSDNDVVGTIPCGCPGQARRRMWRTGTVDVAESEGFEPPDLLQSTVFKTAAFDRSANSPVQVVFGADYI